MLRVDCLNLADRLTHDAIGRDGQHGLPGVPAVFGSEDDALARLGPGRRGLLTRNLCDVPIDKAAHPSDSLIDEAQGREVVGRDGKTLPCRSAVAGLRQWEPRPEPGGDVSDRRIQALDRRQR